MAKWIRRTVTHHAPAGMEATINFAASSSGSMLLMVAVSPTVPLGTPAGWTLAGQSTADLSLYVWVKTAVSDESTAIIPMSLASFPVQAIVYEFSAGSTVLDIVEQSAVPRTGVAVTGLSGLPTTPKVLMHFGGFVGSGATRHIFSTLTTLNHWANSTLHDAWVGLDGVENVSSSVGLLAGYEEDSNATSWAPVCYMDNTGGFHWNTERITLAIEAAEEPSQPIAVYYDHDTSGWQSAVPVIWDHDTSEWVESS